MGYTVEFKIAIRCLPPQTNDFSNKPVTHDSHFFEMLRLLSSTAFNVQWNSAVRTPPNSFRHSCKTDSFLCSNGIIHIFSKINCSYRHPYLRTSRKRFCVSSDNCKHFPCSPFLPVQSLLSLALSVFPFLCFGQYINKTCVSTLFPRPRLIRTSG